MYRKRALRRHRRHTDIYVKSFPLRSFVRSFALHYNNTWKCIYYGLIYGLSSFRLLWIMESITASGSVFLKLVDNGNGPCRQHFVYNPGGVRRMLLHFMCITRSS